MAWSSAESAHGSEGLCPTAKCAERTAPAVTVVQKWSEIWAAGPRKPICTLYVSLQIQQVTKQSQESQEHVHRYQISKQHWPHTKESVLPLWVSNDGLSQHTEVKQESLKVLWPLHLLLLANTEFLWKMLPDLAQNYVVVSNYINISSISQKKEQQYRNSRWPEKDVELIWFPGHRPQSQPNNPCRGSGARLAQAWGTAGQYQSEPGHADLSLSLSPAWAWCRRPWQSLLHTAPQFGTTKQPQSNDPKLPLPQEQWEN